MLSEKISQALAHIKKTTGIKTQEEAALAVGISPSRLKNMVTGRVKKLTTDEALGFQHRYGIRVVWWTNDEAPMLLTEGEAAVMPALNDMRLATEETVKLGLSDAHARVVAELLMNVRRGDGRSVAQQLETLTKGSDAGYVYVPRFDLAASAGNGAHIHDEAVVDHLAFRRDWVQRALGLDPTSLALIDARGDSMSPTIENGDLLLLDTRNGQSRSDGIYVINLAGALLVKRLRIKLSGTVEVMSDNPKYSSEAVSGSELDRLVLVGRVVWHGRKI
jgi:phage repressor protein C with HTH and peptisase S24 domain/plasmid maintenance system antidote protein VapI